MKRIILVDGLDENNVHELEAALSNSTLIYKISLEDSCVIVEGNSDHVYQAKQIIMENSYLIL